MPEVQPVLTPDGTVARSTKKQRTEPRVTKDDYSPITKSKNLLLNFDVDASLPNFSTSKPADVNTPPPSLNKLFGINVASSPSAKLDYKIAPFAALLGKQDESQAINDSKNMLMSFDAPVSPINAKRSKFQTKKQQKEKERQDKKQKVQSGEALKPTGSAEKSNIDQGKYMLKIFALEEKNNELRTQIQANQKKIDKYQQRVQANGFSFL